MAAMPATGTMTAREFLALPEAQLGRPWNLVEGELVMTDATLLHQRVVAGLFHELRTWIAGGPGRGEVTLPISVLIDDRNVYTPDLLWYAQARLPADPTARPYAVPDLAVEVRSPSTWRHDIGAKKAGYERAGLRELWLVDTAARAVLVFRRSGPDAPTFDVAPELGAGDVLESPLLGGFGVPVDRVFASG